MRLISKSITAALISCAVSAGWAANTIAPQNGNWIIADELGGKPGRGMGIDVQDGIFLMQLYNYNKDGSATFHMATGPVVDNKVDTPLKKYKDGPYFGGGRRDGVEAEDAGNVKIEFTSRTTAMIQLPGEEAKLMHRFNYESTPEDQWSDPAFVERWAMVAMDADGNPTTTFFADTGVGSQMAMSPDMAAGWPYKSSSKFTVHTLDVGSPKVHGFMECEYLGSNLEFSCVGEQIDTSSGSSVRKPISLVMQRSIDDLQGTLTLNGNDTKVIGARVEQTSYAMEQNKVVTTAYFRRNSLPEAGTWIVSSEVTGKAGRGISLDLQKVVGAKHMLFMPIYNYDEKGNATFHIGMAIHSPSAVNPTLPAIPVMKYKGGRYLGGPAQDGVEDVYFGPAQVTFNTTATGLVHFPKEDPVSFKRFYFGINQDRVESLVGTWALVPHGGAVKHRILHLKKTASGVVEDKAAGYTCTVSYWLDQRFVCEPKTLTSDQQRIRLGAGYYGAARAILGDGGSLPDSTPELTAIRIADGQGNLVQGGPLYPVDDEGSNPGNGEAAAPTAQIGAVTSAVEGSTVTLEGSGKAAPGKRLTYKWALNSAPAGSVAQLTSADTINPSFVADKAGSYVITLVVNDGSKDSAAAKVTVTAIAKDGIRLLLDDDSSASGKALSWPYTGSSEISANVACVGACDTTYKITQYKLQVNGADYTIANLKATNLTTGSNVKASFEGLSEGQVIASDKPVSFALRSAYTSGKSVNLSFSFTIKETGQSFNYTSTFKTN